MVAYFRFTYYTVSPDAGLWDSMFPSTEESRRTHELIQERKNQDIIISAPSPIATIVFPDGSTSQVSLPFFEKPFNHREAKTPNELWGPEVLIAPTRVESFKVVFPDIYLNGKKLDISPVEFQKSKETYAPVLNC